jgi:hypothetical protein
MNKLFSPNQLKKDKEIKGNIVRGVFGFRKNLDVMSRDAGLNTHLKSLSTLTNVRNIENNLSIRYDFFVFINSFEILIIIVKKEQTKIEASIVKN